MAPVGTPGGGGGTRVLGGGGTAADVARELLLADGAWVAVLVAPLMVVFDAGLAAPVVETQRGANDAGAAVARRDRSRSR